MFLASQKRQLLASLSIIKILPLWVFPSICKYYQLVEVKSDEGITPKQLKSFSLLNDFDATVQLFVLVLMFIISKDPCTAQLICPIICLHVELSVGQHYTLLFLSMYLV